MMLFIISFAAALLGSLLIVRSGAQHGRLSADHDLLGPQKFHCRPVPRIGGLAVFAAIALCTAWAGLSQRLDTTSFGLLILASLPAFIFGLVEDLTKSVSPRRRLFFTVISAGLAFALLNAAIQRTDIPGLDPLLTMLPFSVALTLFTVTGVANSINIIDGFNGLASMCVFLMLLALAYVAYQVNDPFLFQSAVITAGAVLGFFVWNFPAGLIFLGDGGAYLLGFILAEVGILLVHRNQRVSPIFPLLLCAYPIFETIFTMYRRKLVRGVATAAPDGIHLHTLIHRRLIRWTLPDNPGRRRLTRRNSMTSPYLWILCLSSVVPAVLWWHDTAMLSWFLLAFAVMYTWIYGRIVRFRTPRWMIFRRGC